MGGLVAGILLSLFLLPPVETTISNRMKYAIYFMRIISLFLYGLFLGILIHHFSTSNIDEVQAIFIILEKLITSMYRNVLIVDMFLVYQLTVFVIKKNNTWMILFIFHIT